MGHVYKRSIAPTLASLWGGCPGSLRCVGWLDIFHVVGAVATGIGWIEVGLFKRAHFRGIGSIYEGKIVDSEGSLAVRMLAGVGYSVGKQPKNK